ncbi:MAG: hypothetical protein WC551_10935 [Patescibacteria group bacterium]
MPNPINSNIIAPRVPFLDERTGNIAREWYLFLLSLFTLTGSGTSTIVLSDVLDIIAGNVRITASDTTLLSTDNVLIVTAPATVTIPTAVGNTNTWRVKRRTTLGNVVLQPQPGETIDGMSDLVINVNEWSVDIRSDGTNWVIL